MKTLAIATCALTFGLTSFGGLTDGLIAHYKFDGNANDSTANKNNGVVQGATLTADRFGNANSAYLFAGDDWIEVANSTSLQSVTRAMAFSAWVKPSSPTSRFIPVFCKGMPKEQFCFLLQLGRQDRIMINDCNGTGTHKNGDVHVILPNGTLDRNIWYHVAATYDGKNMKVYINGQCVGSSVIEDSFAATTSSLYIGMDPPGAIEYLNGSLDEIRIYNRTLSDKEIADICTQESRNR